MSNITYSTYVEMLKMLKKYMHVVRLQTEVIMNFVDNDGESEPWKGFNFCVRANGGGYKEWFLSLCIRLLCLLSGGDDGESLTGEKFCGKNLLIIYLFCRVEKRLPVSHNMKKL